MTLFAQLCGAPLRNKPGQTCRAFALKDSPSGRCRIHAGRPPKDSGSPEGRAATRAGHAAYYAKRKAAIHRGETVKPNGGRPKRWPIPRWWRLKLSKDEEATVIRAMLASDARCGITRPPWSPAVLPADGPARTFARGLIKGLDQFERSFILALNDAHRRLPEQEMELLYRNIREGEQILGLPGSAVRLKRLAWERHQFLLRALTRTGLRPGAVRSALPATSSPHETSNLGSPSPHETPNLGSPFQPANDLPTESGAERKDRELQAAYEHSMAIVEAGKATGQRRRQLGELAASRVPGPGPVRIGPRLTIAPWLYGR
jgi:hypothetical protein